MNIRAFQGVRPTFAEGVYVDPAGLVIGDVHLGQDCSVWPFAVLRGDVNRIAVGVCSNVQDGAVLHVTGDSAHHPGGHALEVGALVTVGHRAVLHGCRVGDRCLVGIGAVVLDGAEVEADTIIAAGALVPPGKRLEGGYLYVGSPVRRARPLMDRERESLAATAERYRRLKETCRAAAGV